jgi:hypothetical protein
MKTKLLLIEKNSSFTCVLHRSVNRFYIDLNGVTDM